MAKPKPAKQGNSSNAPRTGSKHISNARHHGRTFCTRCGTKIAFGMQFCNGKCRQAFIDGERGPGARNTPARRLADAIDTTIRNLQEPDAAYADSGLTYP